MPSLSDFELLCILHSDSALVLRTVECRFFSQKSMRHINESFEIGQLLWKLRLCVSRAAQCIIAAIDILVTKSWEDCFVAACDGEQSLMFSINRANTTSSGSMQSLSSNESLKSGVSTRSLSPSSGKKQRLTKQHLSRFKWENLYVRKNLFAGTSSNGTAPINQNEKSGATLTKKTITDLALAHASPAVRMFANAFLTPLVCDKVFLYYAHIVTWKVP